MRLTLAHSLPPCENARFYRPYELLNLHCLEFVFSKNYFNLAVISLLGLVKMTTNQTECPRLEQRSVIKFLVTEKCKPCKIYKRMRDVYGEACFSKKNVYKWAKLFKDGRLSIEDEDKPGRPTMASTPEMVDSVNALILADSNVTIEDISEQLGISVGTAHKIVHVDLSFYKVGCRWVPRSGPA